MGSHKYNVSAYLTVVPVQLKHKIHLSFIKKIYKEMILFFQPILLLMWSLWFGVVSTVLYLTYPMQQAEWKHPVLDVFINSFMRPVWGLAIGWMIFACAKGYGGK